MKSNQSSTRAVHAGSQRHNNFHTIPTPITQAATYTFTDTAELTEFMHQKVWGGHDEGFREEYGRYGNPSMDAVEGRLAALEGGESALLYASGMAAITNFLLASLPTGAHIILTDDCYRRTRQFCMTYLKRLGITTTVVSLGDYDGLEAAIDAERTRVIISESPTNPYLRIVDFARLAAIGKRHKVRTLIDSTFGTPINQQPLAFGIDYVVHSATKYLAGHHDLLAGVIVGRRSAIAALRQAQGVLGAVVAPQTAFLLERSLKTLALRIAKHNENGLRIATFLEKHPAIERVWYPGLASHPDHDLAIQQMQGFGGVVSFTVKGNHTTTSHFIDRLEIPYIAPSLGGTESLVEQPAIMSYYDREPEERLALGIPDNLVRLATGIEDAEDLIADIEQALEGEGAA
ncbi:MAG: aminotransferase class I/II-fold pyridoxal phosphate-dependent enzyme [Chloroflexi bacterium]|nr:aminotransferase class I/II-fold pyridoxal phosphate-dependent enzyme [Chloroflexota bacterium]